jgi:hypothetical protein
MTDATIDSDQWRPYHIAGVVLVPLGYRGKVPMIRGWTTTAFDRRKTIKAAIRHKTNLGFRCDAGWIVVDYDSRRDPTGVQWARFLSEYEIDPTAYPYVETGGDGIHLYMRNPTGALVVGTLPGFDAIEFKAGPRQVVCAGSGHPNGKPYRWRAGTVALKDAPAIP